MSRPPRNDVIRRSIAALLWILTVTMTAAWAWVIAQGEFMDSMMAAVPAEQRARLDQGWWIVAFVALARARYDAERTAADFAERLRDEVDLATVSGDIVGVVDTALHPSTIGVWICRPGPTIS